MPSPHGPTPRLTQASLCVRDGGQAVRLLVESDRVQQDLMSHILHLEARRLLFGSG